MTFDTLNVWVDTAEPRIKRDRIVSLVDGRHWDIMKSTAFVDGITRTGMLMPLRYTPQWDTTTTGLYARLKKADYTFTTDPYVPVGTPPPYPDGTATDQSKWVEVAKDYAGNVYMHSEGVNDRAVTNKKFPRNQPFLLSWFSYNSGNTAAVQMECGWFAEDGMIFLRIWTDGKCEIYKNGEQVGEGNIFERHVTTQTIYGRQATTRRRPKAGRGDAKQLAQQVVEVMLIPCRRRDLLLLSNQGGGFRFTFEDLDADNPDNTITPANSRFIWKVPQGQVSVLLHPLGFSTTGQLISTIRTSRVSPDTGEVPEYEVFQDTPGYGGNITYDAFLVDPVDDVAFTPDGKKNRVRVKVAMTGSGDSSPWIYGASGVFDAVTEDTNSDFESDLTPYILSNDLSVPETPSDVHFKVTLKAPEEIETNNNGAAYIRTIGNRPVECRIGSISFLTGRSKAPSWKESTSDVTRELMLEFRDRCKGMEEYRFKTDTTPYDGLELAEALESIAILPGYPIEDIDIPTFGLPLPTATGPSEGDFALLPEIGDKCLDWFVRLWENFARHTQWGWRPTVAGPRLEVRTLDALDAGPSLATLYPRVEDAVNIGGIPFDQAPLYVYRSLDATRIECEANEIWVTGRDPRTGLPFQTRWRDLASLDPALAPNMRPTNWLGEPRVYAWCDPAITDRDTASWVAATLARRLTVTRDVYQFECFFQLQGDGSPLWRGDKLTLWGIGDVRITAFSGRFELENPDRIWETFRYTGELCP